MISSTVLLGNSKCANLETFGRGGTYCLYARNNMGHIRLTANSGVFSCTQEVREGPTLLPGLIKGLVYPGAV